MYSQIAEVAVGGSSIFKCLVLVFLFGMALGFGLAYFYFQQSFWHRVFDTIQIVFARSQGWYQPAFSPGWCSISVLAAGGAVARQLLALEG